MSHTKHNQTTALNPAATMEAEERSLVKDEKVEEMATLAAIKHEIAIDEIADQPNMKTQGDIHPEVSLHTDKLAQSQEATPAAEMDSEERDLVIDNSVAAVCTFAEHPLTDQQIRQQALTKETQILPDPEDKSSN